LAKQVAIERQAGSDLPENTTKSDNTVKKLKPVVLVIHQDDVLINTCRSVLEKHGYEIEFAADGTEGVQKVYQVIPDVILAGSSVPELNGYQICRLIKNDPVMRKIPMLLIADLGLKMDRFWAMKAGADDFISKDALEAKLLQKITMVLEIYERMDIDEKRLLKANNEKNPFNIRTRLNQILDTSLVESMLMVEFRSLADLVHDSALLNYMFFSLLESILEYDAAAIFYHDENRGPRKLTVHLPDGKKQPSAQIEKMMAQFFSRFKDRGLTAAQLEMQESEVIGTLDDEAEVVEYSTAYVREVRLDSQLIGGLALYSSQKVDYTKIFPVHLIEDEVRLLMKLRHLYSQAEILAITDSLTNLYNHRHFMATLQREFKSSKRYEQELTLAFVGVDNFKQLNDEWGHACGDEILKHVGQLMESSFRSVDIMARFGGKNLAVLFPQTPASQALTALERFRARVAESPLLWKDNQLRITVCAGLAALTEDTASMVSLIKDTEDALSQARDHGGNRIEISKG
jgi:two-component system cell cycle response regulator